MSQPPAQPKIYHITHGRNLARIAADGCLWSDAEIISRGGPEAAVGISEIKKRRLDEPTIACHPETTVGQYVPFYFCPRSIMLYILHMGNHPNLTYSEGQRPILHLEADLYEVLAWADGEGRPWAFTDRNAGSAYFQSFGDIAQLC
jgi:ssDNA thymidine ADP-ribosyltransferase, DarT